MIRSLTIIANEKEPGKTEYTFNGNLSLEESASAIVSFALQVPRSEQKKEEIKVPDQPQPPL